MDIGIALEIGEDVKHLSRAVDRINGKLSNFFAGRDYGPDVINISIGLILVGPKFREFHPVRALKYRKRFKYKSLLSGEVVELHNVIEYDVMPDYEVAKSMGVAQAERLFVAELLQSVGLLKRHQRKYPNFDVDRFGVDLLECLQIHGEESD